MKKLILPIIICIGFSNKSIAQEKSKNEIKGDKYAFKYSFDKAIESYLRAKSLTPEGQRHLAEAYHNMNQNTESEIAYAKLVNLPSGVLPEDYFKYAMVLKSNNKYDLANTSLDKFKELKPSDLRAIDYTMHKADLSNLITDSGKYKLTSLDINSEAQDFGTSYYKTSLVFASTRARAKMIKRTSNWNGKPYLDMYSSEIKDNQLTKPEIFDKALDGKLHDGPASFNSEGTYVAFTRNHYHDKSIDKMVELQIYFSSYVDGKWSTPTAFSYNNENYSVGHPCLSADGKALYFTSNMPGGFGGADLYRTTRNDNGEWNKPENLGNKINTEGDETFPFVDEKNKKLFFSSNGRFGLGGLDVFISSINGSVFSNVYNAGSPLNTRFDDFSVIMDPKTNKGYLSSNRENGKGDDDIYGVEFLKNNEPIKTLKGIAKDLDGNAVSNSHVLLLDEKGQLIDSLITTSNAAYTFSVVTNKQYKLVGKHESYTNGESDANTLGKELVVVFDLILLKQVKETKTEEKEPVIIKEGTDLGKTAKFKTIYFDLDKYAIRADAETELKKMITIMNDNPNMVIELRAHTDCRETKYYNQVLSDKRAQASVDYIRKGITKPERITGKGFGKSQLINNCACDGDVVSLCSEAEHQKNRRTEFIVIKK